MIKEKLIYDIGVNHGEDTDFYLRKGFQVVGVEANPLIYAELVKRFHNEITNGDLVLLNKGISGERGTAKFYVNEDNDHWSSFVEAYGTRNGTRYHTVDIDCLTIADLLAAYGTPYYMKIDVEGIDKTILENLAPLKDRPSFVSVEEYGLACIDDLKALGGYTKFTLAAQNNKTWAQNPPNPPLEGLYVTKVFNGKDSGLFGKELPGEWLSYEAFRALFARSVRAEDYTYVGPQNEWFDVHATM